MQSLFLPASQVSHERVQSLDQVFKEEDKLKVMVLSFDHERGRVSFSTKQLQKNQGDMLRSPQQVGVGFSLSCLHLPCLVSFCFLRS